MSDLQRRRQELLHEIKQKDRRTKHFAKDKRDAENLVCLFFSPHLGWSLKSRWLIVSNIGKVFTRSSRIHSWNSWKFWWNGEESSTEQQCFGQKEQSTCRSTSFAIIHSYMRMLLSLSLFHCLFISSVLLHALNSTLNWKIPWIFLSLSFCFCHSSMCWKSICLLRVYRCFSLKYFVCACVLYLSL